ncbi:hypothetical protein BLS_008360 [Venturia inaequalis]|uniref:Uncharacterized protein n=1 Tax=Venturia inaequalis TaxID=5025 RepID=A0A8H3YVF0_VENIN|nr:hypothetical protein EG328_004435 [Venturia inaequalis]KAE9980768.1 hypothetical protein BLS_008360 [Venturia inaequalis]
MASSPLLNTTTLQTRDSGEERVEKKSAVGRARDPSAHYLEIALASAFVAIPVIAIIIGLLAIITSHRTAKSDILLPSAHTSQGSCSQPSFQITFSATTLTFLASLLSTFAAYVAVPLMFLLSFRIARSLRSRSKGIAHELPTPYQAGLLVGLIGGSKKRVSPLSAELTVATCSLSCIVALGLLCQLGDAWFHKATQTILYTHIGSSASPVQAFSRTMSEACRLSYSREQFMYQNREPSLADRLPCTMASADQSYYPVNSSEGYKLAQGASGTLNNITTVLVDGTAIALMVPSNPRPSLDWRAKSIGVTTQCENIAKKCMNSAASIGGLGNSEFRCPKSLGFPSDFSGSMGIYQGGSAWNWTLFPNSLLANTSKIQYNLPNPYNFILQAVGTEQLRTSLSKDPEMVVVSNSFFSNTILRCNTTIYDVIYTSINGTVNIEDHQPSNLNMSQSINGPTIFSLLSASSKQATLQSFVQSGFSYALFSSDSVAQMSQSFANAYSRVTLAFGSVALTPVETLVEQERTESLVTCVPKAPLWTLVGLAVLYLFLALVLTIIAVRNTSADVADIQSQLSIHGLAAKSFEAADMTDDILNSGVDNHIEDRFEELHGRFGSTGVRRVGFTTRSESGWEYQVVRA